jgi:hypothetical protein
MSILVMTTMTGTLSARAMPRCSLRIVSVDTAFPSFKLLLAHADQAIVGSYHKQAVVGTAAQQTKDSSS